MAPLEAVHARAPDPWGIGFAGVGGAGKSTLVPLVAGHFADRGAKVAILAVDPSSPMTGGAVLGDRIRSMRAPHDGVYFRSLASRGGTGGLSTCIADVVRRMSAAGRKDEMIISGGYNIAPREIEDVLYQNAAVQEAAVVGEADPEWGPAVVAYIALRDPAADLGAILEHAKASLGFKRPKRLYGVGELPNNAAGKRQKSALKPALAIRRSETVTRT